MDFTVSSSKPTLKCQNFNILFLYTIFYKIYYIFYNSKLSLTQENVLELSKKTPEISQNIIILEQFSILARTIQQMNQISQTPFLSWVSNCYWRWSKKVIKTRLNVAMKLLAFLGDKSQI